jgi:hypothetical protein
MGVTANISPKIVSNFISAKMDVTTGAVCNRSFAFGLPIWGAAVLDAAIKMFRRPDFRDF